MPVFMILMYMYFHCNFYKRNNNMLKAELNPICHLLVLLGTHHILHVSRIRVKCQVKSHPLFAGIVWNSPYSPR